MPLHLDFKRRFSQRSDRVKGVDLHPTEPWLLANLYSGSVYIWNTNDQSLVRSFEVTELPVRASKFVARKQWVVCGADDMQIRVFNYNTMDKVKVFEAHADYIRSLAVHPSLPYLLSASDDMLIKLWDWDKGWSCNQIFEGHSHYVMQVTFNPKDTNTFASASLDRTVKVWSIGSPTPNFTLEGHDKGVNSVDYYNGGDKPYLISGADDKLVKIWDYQTKACVQTLEGHTHNVSAAFFHPELPIILTGSEDGTLRVWHANTYRPEYTLNYSMERLWSLSYVRGSNSVAIGYDEGTVVVKIGREEPVVSMDTGGKVIWARHNEIQTVNVRSVGDVDLTDGERMALAIKDLGACDLYPQSLVHNPNGRFVTVCGDGEYIIYTALAWRNKSFGSALEFVWGEDSNVYATRESTSLVKIYKNFKEANSLRPGFSAEGIYGGTLLSVRSNDFICFYDWTTLTLLRRIEVPVKEVKWSDNGELVALITETAFYTLQFSQAAVDDYIESGQEIEEDGIEEAFEFLNEVQDRVRTGMWVGDCFIYNNSAWRLNYCVGGEVTVMYHLDRPMYLLGYLQKEAKVYLIDKSFGVARYSLNLAVIEYKTLIIRENEAAAEEALSRVPKDQLNAVAHFLESRGQSEKALEIATEPDYKFELAVNLGRLDLALEFAEGSESEAKWKQLGELALSSGKLDVAERCLKRAKDLSGLLLLHTAQADSSGLGDLAENAQSSGKQNVAFLSLFLLGRLDDCINLLISSGRISEAAFFARTYRPSRISECVQLWRKDLSKINPKAAEALADPEKYPNLFPDLDVALQAEARQESKLKEFVPAKEFESYEGSTSIDLIEQLKNLALGGNGQSSPIQNGTHQEESPDSAESPQNPASPYTSRGLESQGASPYAQGSNIGDKIEEQGLEGTEGHEELYTASHAASPNILPGQTADDAGLSGDEGLDGEDNGLDDEEWGLDDEEV